jgi:NAD(P)-dependent dehydrogenase (short-subunit alcohol dehydrogenase family)
MKGTQRGRDLRIGKPGEHAALLARQNFRRPQQLTETLRLELSPQNIVLKLIEPGFVPTTRLVEKAQANAPVLTIVPPEYEAYVNQRMAVFSSEFPVELATPEDVADAILASVNDETGQLRWVVGADQAERMYMRHETSEAKYNDWTWSQLGPSR